MAATTLTFKNNFDQLFRDAWWVSDPEAELKPWARETARKFYHQFGGKTDFLTIYNAILKAAAAAEQEDNQEPKAKHTKYDSDGDATEVTLAVDASDEAQLAAVFKQMLQIADELAAEMEKAETDSEASRHEHDSDYETESEEESEEDDYSSESDDSEELTVGQRRYREAQRQAKELAKPTPTFAEEGEPTKAEFNAGRNEMNRLLFSEYNKWWDAFEAEAEEQADGYSAADRFSWHAAKILSRRTGLSRAQIQPVVGAWLLEHARA